MNGTGRLHDVIVVGAGPAGLGATRRLRELGVGDVVILDREAEGGGIPRHCHHTGYGLRDFGRLMTGPAYARRTVEGIGGAQLRTSMTVTALGPGGEVSVTGPEGPERLTGRRVVLATGVRETPRSARLVSGTRPLGVTTTGALQQMVYRSRQRPFREAVIIGTELVSFSALLTLRAAGIRAVAMIEENVRITARRPADLAARAIFGVPVLISTRLVAIEGGRQVKSVTVERDGKHERIQCDGVVFTGRFRPENTLIATSHLATDPRSLGPVVDQFGRCSDHAYFATGNLLHPVETAGRCYRDGLRTGDVIARDLTGNLGSPHRSVPVQIGEGFSYITPHVVTIPDDPGHRWSFNARASHELNGRLRISVDGVEAWSRTTRVLPERRINLPQMKSLDASAVEIKIDFQPH